MKKRGRIGILIVFLVILSQAFFRTDPAHADIAPPSSPVGSDIFPPSETTNVRMVKESVLLDISADSSHPNGLAKVTAEFQMRNLGDVPEIMDVRFPLNWDMAQYRLNLSDEDCYTGFPAIDDFSVTVNGLQEDITMTGRTEPTNDQGTPEPALLPCWAHFIVTFLPKQDVTITVSYTVKGYLDNGISQVAFYYVLTTRAGWKDTIGTADITVRFPYPINDMNFLGGTEGWLSAGGREVK